MVFLSLPNSCLMEDLTHSLPNGDHHFIPRHDSLTSSPALLPLSPDKQYLGSAVGGDEASVIATTTPSGNGVSGHEILSLDSFRKRSEVMHFFPCYEVATDGKLTPSFLACTSWHMFILHQLPESPDHAAVQARRALNSIVKITSKKNKPDVLTISYGVKDEDGSVKTWHTEKFLVPNSETFVKSIEALIKDVMEAFQL